MTAIAIDGPAGAGKSTIARAVAQRMGYIYIDTGALYRAIGLFALRKGRSPSSAQEVTPLLPEIALSLRFISGVQHVFLCGEDVSEAIRTPEAAMAASDVSAIPAVREYLLDTQRDFAKKSDVVMDGRDIGTVVLPQAQVKIFLTATPETRARRRYLEMLGKGQTADYDTLLREVIQRDRQDTTRAAAPLRQAQDAWLCDTTELTFDEALEAICRHINKKLGDMS